MPSYIFTVHGLPVDPNRPCSLEIPFDADNDNSAIEHSVSNLSVMAKRHVLNCGYAKLFHSDRSIIGAIDLDNLSWTPGPFDHTDHPIYAGYTRNQLHAALLAVQDKSNWKNPIDAIVPQTWDPNLLSAAIAFYCGSPSEVSEIEGSWHVTAPGYYVCVGA